MDSGEISLSLANAIGMRISVSVKDPADLHAKMRVWGSRGWASGEYPDGGFVLPYAMADVFDWSLIGARHFVLPDGTQAVERLGLVWKRRDLPENKPKKMPAKITYSRGARGAERDETKEQKDDYVWLIQFVGGGRISPEYCKPTAPRTQEPARSVSPQATLAASKERASITTPQLAEIADILDKAHPGVRARALADARAAASSREDVKTRADFSEAEGLVFIATLKKSVARYELERTS